MRAVRWGFPCCAPSLALRLRHHLGPSEAGDNEAMLDGIRGGFIRLRWTGLSSLFKSIQSLSHGTVGSQAGTPRDIAPPRAPQKQPFRDFLEHLPVETPTLLSLYMGSHPGTNCLSVPNPIHPPPSILTAVGTPSRCQDSSELHCPGQASTAATREEVWTPNKTGNAKETPEEVKRQTGGGINPPKTQCVFLRPG